MRSLFTAAILSLTLASAPATAQATDDALYEQLDLLMQVFQRVRAEYVDEVEDKEIVEAAIQGMLKSLDPHSTYLNEDVFNQVRVQIEGAYGGLGIEVQMENGLVKVVTPIDGTPADRAGIQGGDFISHIDGDPVKGKTLTEAIKVMRGKVGAPIVITVLREGEADPFDVEIIREKITVQSVVHRVEDNSVGYIRVSTFNMLTGEGVERSIRSLRDELGDGLDGVILDLRNNPGGLLNEAIRVSDAFLDRGEIVSTRGRRRNYNDRWYATAGDMLDGLPVIVLVNAYSASASEIVAGALKDHRRAVVLGDRTFGKGTVQGEFRLGGGKQALRLTTSRYYTPSGNSIQGRGIEPDIELLHPGAQYRRARREADLMNTIENDTNAEQRPGEFVPLTDEEVRKARQPLTDEEKAAIKAAGDVQLTYAVQLLKDLAARRRPIVAQSADTASR